jgi:hypothetical protein
VIFSLTLQPNSGQYSATLFCKIYQSWCGDIIKEDKLGSSISHTLEYGLQPTRQPWERHLF